MNNNLNKKNTADKSQGSKKIIKVPIGEAQIAWKKGYEEINKTFNHEKGNFQNHSEIDLDE